jgi:hypothetical protein
MLPTCDYWKEKEMFQVPSVLKLVSFDIYGNLKVNHCFSLIIYLSLKIIYSFFLHSFTFVSKINATFVYADQSLMLFIDTKPKDSRLT